MTRDGKLTKLDMAQVIIQALYFMPELPPVKNVNVRRLARDRKWMLIEHHKRALKIIQDGLEAGTWPRIKLIRDRDIADLLPILPND